MKPSRRTPLRSLLLWILAMTLCSRPGRADDLYQPVAADFQSLYGQDGLNQRYQRWGGGNGYWFWVRTFYQGYTRRVLGLTLIHQAGWLTTSRRLVSRVVSPSARQELTLELNALGRDIAGDWAKDDRVERIHDGDLRRWGDQTAQAGSRDDGNGQVLLATVRAIQAEVNARLKGRPAG